ncbi:DUF6064 family protein [Sulfuriflexus mobilis]|uniref:DUF6064 family protein n=1 Tax=Sulfuriflexus mobilis TaxID=1811807 RepID=UPI000F825239|nr:DUF6064 family protein [Sulfuriflexus mobilis]
MGDLTDYRLSDFILFSETAYYRQFELYNQAIWPLHCVAILFSLLMLYMLWKNSAWAGRVISGLLVVSWLWVAWAFLYQRFYQIHVVADWYALGFVLHAGFLAWYGVVKNRFDRVVSSRPGMIIGAALLSIALIVYPFIAVIRGRGWMQFEMFALAPDPTVLATVAILLFYKAPKVLYAIPIIWVLISGMTLYVM